MGRVAIFYRYFLQIEVKVLKQHKRKILSFQVVSGGQRWLVIGCYLFPNNVVTIKHVAASIFQRPCMAELLVDGDFNTYLTAPEGRNCLE